MRGRRVVELALRQGWVAPSQSAHLGQRVEPFKGKVVFFPLTKDIKYLVVI